MRRPFDYHAFYGIWLNTGQKVEAQEEADTMRAAANEMIDRRIAELENP